MVDHDEIEKTFQRVEEEMEKRAREQEAREEASEATRASSRAPAPAWGAMDAPPGEAENVVQDLPEGGTMRSQRKRRRGSISISRLGQAQDPASDLVGSNGLPISQPTSPVANATSHQQSNPTSRVPTPLIPPMPQNGSTASLASAASSATDRSDHHTTQREEVAPKKTITQVIGRVISRRLTVSKSKSPLSTPGDVDDVVIDVQVETRERDSASMDVREGAHVVAGSAADPVHVIRHMPSTASSQSSSRNKRWSAKLSRFAGKILNR